MAKPTYQDATLIIQMAQLGSEMDTAKPWVWSDKFIPDFPEFIKKYPQGSEEYGNVMKIIGWMELLGTFYKHKLINEELLFDWLAVDLVWNRLKGFALGVREQAEDLRLYENFEALAKAEKG